MSLIWSIPTGVLLVAALFIFLINRSRSNIGAAWFAAILAGLFVWGWTISLYFRPDVQIVSITETVPGISTEAGTIRFEENAYFVLDGISYPYMLAISSLLVILLLTAPSFMDPQIAPRLWLLYLLIEIIGYLSVSANNVSFIIYGWVIFDAIDLAAQYIQVRPERIRRGFLTAIGVRFVGTLMAAASLALSYSELGRNSGNFISLRAGAYLFTACALRIGIIPISQPYTEMSASRVGLGTMLRLVSVLTVMPVLSRVPLGGLRPNLRLILSLASTIASLTGAVGWLLSENSFSGISYAALGICGIVFECALSRAQSVLILWGVSIALTCAPLSLYQIHNRFMNLLVFLVVLCFSGIPYMPNAAGWEGLMSSPNLVQNIVFVLIVMILIAGALIHIFRKGERKFSELEPWMRSVYPIGFIISIGTYVFISTTAFDTPFSMGVIPASSAALGGGIFLALLVKYMPASSRTQNAAAWGRAGMTLFWRGMQNLMDMNWLIGYLRWFSKIFESFLRMVSTVLENNGGLIWELLILALLIVIAFGGGFG